MHKSSPLFLLSLSHTRMHVNTPAFTRTHSHACTHTLILTLPHSHTHARTHTPSLSLTLPHTHTLPHIHTPSPSYPLTLPRSQGAAGTFQLLQELVFSHLQSAPTPDLSAETTTAMMQLMLAQAQESICIKASRGGCHYITITPSLRLVPLHHHYTIIKAGTITSSLCYH